MSKQNIILDLDQTIIYSLPTEDFKKEDKEKLKKFKHHYMDGYYVVFERPGLQEFLDFIFSNFVVSIWTAATRDYALFIIEKIILTKPERHLNYFFFNYHVGISEKIKKSTKNLSMLWDIYKLNEFSPDNTVIIDDYDDVYNPQKSNCIFAKPFMADNDTFLIELTPKLKKLKKNKNFQKEIEKINKN